MRVVFYRVRFDGGGEEPDEFLGTGLVADLDVLRVVAEPDALCFDYPGDAAVAAVQFGRVPFVVEYAR